MSVKRSFINGSQQTLIGKGNFTENQWNKIFAGENFVEDEYENPEREIENLAERLVENREENPEQEIEDGTNFRGCN